LAPRHGVLDRLDGPQVGRNGGGVIVRQIAIHRYWHWGTEDLTIRPFAIAQRLDDLLIGPLANSSIDIWGDIGHAQMTNILV
jgi:hypothetical protein